MRRKIPEVRSSVHDHVHDKVVEHNSHGRRLEIGLELSERPYFG